MKQLLIAERHPFVHRGTAADEGVIQQIFVAQDYSFGRLPRGRELRERFAALAQRTTPLIIDCGANIGASPLFFALEFPGARVVAIEPDPENFELLSRNTADFPVMCLHAAVASKSGRLDLLDPGKGEWGYRTASFDAGLPAARKLSVKAVTLDEVLAMHGESAEPFLLKVDIEGAEADLFAGSTAAIDRFPIVVIELHDWLFPRRATSRPFLRWHASRDRDLVCINENAFSLANS
jgi:FkbM family methyltransferase